METSLATSEATSASFGQKPTGSRFKNLKPAKPAGALKMLRVLKRYLTEAKPHAVPDTKLPVNPINTVTLNALPNQGMHFAKLGHSSVLLKIQGEYWLIDPVFSERASPFSFFGPKRFHPTPISVDALPDVDKVLISHNHYDHLDKSAIRKLRDKVGQFLVPLGVEKTLIKWGVEKDKILSFDWWQEMPTEHGLVAFTPTQHFSGRGLSDGNTSLWGSWVIKSKTESVFFSGDSGYFDGFLDIGKTWDTSILTR